MYWSPGPWLTTPYWGGSRLWNLPAGSQFKDHGMVYAAKSLAYIMIYIYIYHVYKFIYDIISIYYLSSRCLVEWQASCTVLISVEIWWHLCEFTTDFAAIGLGLRERLDDAQIRVLRGKNRSLENLANCRQYTLMPHWTLNICTSHQHMFAAGLKLDVSGFFTSRFGTCRSNVGHWHWARLRLWHCFCWGFHKLCGGPNLCSWSLQLIRIPNIWNSLGEGWTWLIMWAKPLPNAKG